MSKTKTIVTAVVGVLALIVIFQNTAEVKTNILFFTITMPRVILLLVTFGLGALLGILLTWEKNRHRTPSGQ